LTYTDYPIAFWFCAVPAVMILGISKAGFGSGIAILATPLLTLTIPVTKAVGLLLPLLIITDMFALIHYRTHFDSHSIRILVPAACLGIAGATFFFDYFRGSQQCLRFSIGFVALLFVLFQFLRSLILGAMEKRLPMVLEGILMGAASGFFSTLAHAGGPPVIMYLLPQKLEKTLFVGTTVIFFAAVNLIKLLPYHALGLLNAGDIKTILMLAPLTYAGVRLGIYLNRRFSDLWFNRVVYGILFLTGLQLLLGQNLLSLLF
jgi:uncharacterized membrane protein YfcA